MKVPESLRRPDWIRELHGLLLVAVVVSAVVGIVSVIAALTSQPVEIPVPSGEVLRPDALVNTPAGTTVDATADIYLRVEHPTGAQRILAVVAASPGYLLATTMLLLLWRLVARARRDDPFTTATIGRLRTLGWLLVIGGPVAWTVQLVARFALSSTVMSGASATLELGAPAAWFLAGFGMLAISEIVRRAQTLRAELDEVI